MFDYGAATPTTHAKNTTTGIAYSHKNSMSRRRLRFALLRPSCSMAFLQMSLEPWVGIAQKHHVDQGLLRGLILYRELVLGIQVVVHGSEDFLRPLLPYQLHSMLEVVPRGKIHRRKLLLEQSPTIAVVIDHQITNMKV